MSAQKQLPLESLRGLAAVTVALFHFQNNSWLRNNSPLVDNNFVSHGFIMVDFFFVLSGFVIAMNYLERITTAGDLYAFQLRRFWRLYPLHIATLVLCFGTELLKYALVHFSGQQANYPPFQESTPFAFMNHIFLTQAFFLDKHGFNGVSWSISTEFYTYLIFGVTVLLLGKLRTLGFSAILALSSFYLLRYHQIEILMTTHDAIIRCTYSFFMGVIFFQFSRRMTKDVGSTIPFLLLVLTVLAVMDLLDTDYVMFIPLIFGITLMFMAKTTQDGWLNRLLSQRFLVYLGTISYSIYMVHETVWWFMIQATKKLFHAPADSGNDGYLRGVLNPFESTLLVLFGMAIVLGVSTLTWRFIEERFRQKSNTRSGSGEN